MDDNSEELNRIGKGDIFKEPDGYFDSLEQRITSRIDRQGEKKIIPLMAAGGWKWIAAAAAVVAMLVLALPRITQPEVQSVRGMLGEVSAELCLVYLKESDIDPADFFSVEDLDQLFLEKEGGLIRDSDLEEDDADLLFEIYGVTDDEKLKTL
jgi:hypothetical protein